jgi:hypothetical protein
MAVCEERGSALPDRRVRLDGLPATGEIIYNYLFGFPRTLTTGSRK